MFSIATSEITSESPCQSPRLVLANGVARYGSLAAGCSDASFADIDDETLADTLEGLSELPELLTAIIRSCLLDEAFAVGLKGRLTEMKERLDRLVERSSSQAGAGLLFDAAVRLGQAYGRGLCRLLETGAPEAGDYG